MPNGNKNLNLFFSKSIFIGSFKDINDIPKIFLPEFCFIGRSNVGKSSIINSILKSKNLSKTSKTPGRTQSINYFKINNKIYFVDLPGYGYAKLSKNLRKELLELIKSYICNRSEITRIFLLIDSNVGLKDSDIDMIDFVDSYNKNFSIILTKVDKCSSIFLNKQKFSISSFMKNYENNFDKIVETSSKKNIGILDLQKYIYALSKKNEI